MKCLQAKNVRIIVKRLAAQEMHLPSMGSRFLRYYTYINDPEQYQKMFVSWYCGFLNFEWRDIENLNIFYLIEGDDIKSVAMLHENIQEDFDGSKPYIGNYMVYTKDEHAGKGYATHLAKFVYKKLKQKYGHECVVGTETGSIGNGAYHIASKVFKEYTVLSQFVILPTHED